MCNSTILAQIFTFRVVDFSFDIFLAQSFFRKSLIYCVLHNFYNLGYPYWEEFVKVEKRVKHSLNSYMLTINLFFRFFVCLFVCF